MKAELTLIKYFLSHKAWLEYAGYITVQDFPEELKLLWSVLDSWHKTNDNQDIELLDLVALFFSNNPKNKEYYEEIFTTLKEYEVNNVVVFALVNSIRKAKLLKELSLASYEAAEGKRSQEELQTIINGYNKLDETHSKEELFVSDNLGELLNSCVLTPGLRWRLNCLNKSLGSLRKGDFGFIFARPETGKTTFLASEISYMASQLKEEDGPIIWFNNEEQGPKVKIRIIQAVLGVELAKLYSNLDHYQKEYDKIVKGKILLKDDAGLSKWDVERIIKQYKPSLVVFDQLDKVKGFKDDRDDLKLGAIYIWTRELAKAQCPIIGVCQSDGSGENVRWLTMNNVANAKTAKQAEADWILGIGCLHDQGWEMVRFLNISKNKLLGDPDSDATLKHGKFEVLIEPLIARYKDIK